MWKTNVTKKMASASISSVLLMSALFMYGEYAFTLVDAKRNDESAAAIATAYKPRHDYFKNIVLEARAAYVYDLSTGKVIYQHNAEVPLPLASITKAMTAIVASEEASDVPMVTINAEALATEGESGLVAGETWTMENLLAFTLISSSNDGAEAAAEALSHSTSSTSFVASMNTKAAELGLSSLSFNNPTGLDIESTNETGGYGSAKDVAKLFEYAITKHSRLFEQTTFVSKQFSSDQFAHDAKNTNTIIGSIPNLIASKTGFTAKAGGNLAIVFDRGLNQPVIAVVLGSSYDGRFSDIERLASTTLQTYNESR